MLTLTDDEKAMLDGRHGKARQKAMDLLVRYAEALGAERFVDTQNVAGVPGSANAFLQNYYKDKGGPGGDAIFSHFDLDSDELVEAPSAVVHTCHGIEEPEPWYDPLLMRWAARSTVMLSRVISPNRLLTLAKTAASRRMRRLRVKNAACRGDLPRWRATPVPPASYR